VAVGTGRSQVVASSVSSAVGHWQRGNIDFQMGYLLIGGGVFGALAGVKVLAILSAYGQLDLFVSLSYVVLLGVVGALMLIESVQKLLPKQGAAPVSMRRGGQHTWIERLPLKQRFRQSKIYVSAIPPVALGGFVGWLTAIMGVGGGFLLVPAMIYLLRLPTRLVIGTSTFQIVCITAFTTVLQSIQNHSVDILLSLPLMFGGSDRRSARRRLQRAAESRAPTCAAGAARYRRGRAYGTRAGCAAVIPLHARHTLTASTNAKAGPSQGRPGKSCLRCASAAVAGQAAEVVARTPAPAVRTLIAPATAVVPLRLLHQRAFGFGHAQGRLRRQRRGRCCMRSDRGCEHQCTCHKPMLANHLLPPDR
jgi:uncharacterized membrane protein YfcA